MLPAPGGSLDSEGKTSTDHRCLHPSYRKYPRSTKINHWIQKKMPLVVSDEKVAGPENDMNTIDGQGGDIPAGRFLTRTSSIDRKRQETTLTTAIRVIEHVLNLENLHIHEILLHQMLENLEIEHHDFIIKESLDINMEPEKSNMSEFEGKVSRALTKQKVRLHLAAIQP
jgi:hypothetical protein